MILLRQLRLETEAQSRGASFPNSHMFAMTALRAGIVSEVAASRVVTFIAQPA
jgi:hypothetical protein